MTTTEQLTPAMYRALLRVLAAVGDPGFEDAAIASVRRDLRHRLADAGYLRQTTGWSRLWTLTDAGRIAVGDGGNLPGRDLGVQMHPSLLPNVVAESRTCFLVAGRGSGPGEWHRIRRLAGGDWVLASVWDVTENDDRPHDTVSTGDILLVDGRTWRIVPRTVATTDPVLWPEQAPGDVATGITGDGRRFTVERVGCLVTETIEADGAAPARREIVGRTFAHARQVHSQLLRALRPWRPVR